MADLCVDPESQRLLDQRLSSSEGQKLLDDMLRVMAIEVVEGWVREGRQEPTLEEIEKELRGAMLRTLLPRSSSTRVRRRPKKEPQ